MVYSDNEKTAKELLAKARGLADERKEKTVLITVGSGPAVWAKDMVKFGADRVIVTAKELENPKAEEAAQIISTVAEEEGEKVIMVSSTKTGKETAPRLAAKMGAGSASDVTKLWFEGDDLTAERVVYSGNAIAVVRFIQLPAVVTVPGKVFDPLAPDEGRTGEVVERDVPPGEHRSRVLSVEAMRSEGANVEDAEIIVSCGRGFKSSDDLKLINELAEALKGNTVGCSRPIAADLKWLSEDHWIGLSGHKVKPKLYVACGISGQIQHVAGMRDSGIIVAINKDPEAPIFKSADYGIVGDLYTVLPKFISAVKERM